MRIREVRISGFRSIPFCGEYHPLSSVRRATTAQISWASDAFCASFPVAAQPGAPMLSAIMGANSTGKSTILIALNYVFSTITRLDEAAFNGKQTGKPIIIETTLYGPIAEPTEWHEQNCVRRGEGYELTIANVWTTDGRIRYTRRADGVYYKQSYQDRAQAEALMPEFRMIWADTRLEDAADLEKNNLVGDLIDALLEKDSSSHSIVARIKQLISELGSLVDRATSSNDISWQPLEELEASLSEGLAAITPQQNRVRLQLKDNIPSVRHIFAKGVMQIDDGIALDFEHHGLGLQRSFVVSALHTWCEFIRDSARDYLFAIEEPEIYLHPHATRVLLNTLERIAQHDQVIFTTHDSEFINRVPLQNILVVKRPARRGARANEVAGSQVHSPDLSGLSAADAVKAQRYLLEDRSDMLFARAVLLVEGQAEQFALPAFARTLGYDLDAGGVSIVFVNGIGNFQTYHQILAAFGIPHVIMMDGDGKRKERIRVYQEYADALVVLERDFEHLIAESLPKERVIEIIDECQRRCGKPPKTGVGSVRARARALASVGKPLAGRVVGEELCREEVELLGPIVESLQMSVALAQGDTGQRSAGP